MPEFLKKVKEVLSLSCSEQNQEQEQGRYVNVRPYPGTKGELFVGDVANEQGGVANEQEIEGGDQPDGYLFLIAGVDIDRLL